MTIRISKSLLKTDSHRLFKWSKKGIILTNGFATTNLSELEVYEALDILDTLLDGELTTTQEIDIKEVKEYFQERLMD